ncbi:MAG: nucleotidyl transferase AbiEii/AbiGii toxin family protein [Chloroflexi bacterium]|nr:nucleotidyl transferase AbiEii/AbiGii toxin family protein [Chloroflexota bacterium]
MLDRGKHEIILKNILRDIYQHPQLQARLAFKGGSCLYLFYGLPRFSTDLDFTLITEGTDEQFSPRAMSEILGEYLFLSDERQKQFTWFWLGHYEEGMQNIKVEISRRQYPDRFDIQDFLGVTVRTLDLATMFAHKLCAISDRRKLVNRDLFDTWWLLKKMVPIRAEIIEARTGKMLPDHLGYLLTYIRESVDRRHILAGLGELLSQSQKDWARDHLLTELIAQLQMRVDMEGR